MENLKKRIKVRPFEGNRIRRLVAPPAFISCKIFSIDLAAIHRVKTKITHNIPIYIGICVLDLSKLQLHDFWCN